MEWIYEYTDVMYSAVQGVCKLIVSNENNSVVVIDFKEVKTVY